MYSYFPFGLAKPPMGYPDTPPPATPPITGGLKNNEEIVEARGFVPNPPFGEMGNFPGIGGCPNPGGENTFPCP